MTRAGRRAPAAALINPVVLVILSACSSAPIDRTVATSSPPTPTPPAFNAWEETTRERADALVDEAQLLAAIADADAARACMDRAIALVLATPEGYDHREAWQDYLADLLNEADRLEDRLAPAPEAVVPFEIADLPPLEPPDGPPGITVPYAPNALPDSDFPLVRNATVDRFLDAFTRPGEYRTRVLKGLERSGAYLPMIREELAAAGVPTDLAWLPLIESSFSLTATSRARAHGMWQFIASTGRHYGLRIDPLLDERRDPTLSTQAAAAYLSDLFRQFDDWPLALAAYNSGAGNVRRAIRRSGSRDFWALRSRLPRETRNYVPAFIASVIVASRPSAYGMPEPKIVPWTHEAIPVPDALDLAVLAERLDVDLELMRDLNPAVKRDLTPSGRTTTIWVPHEQASAARALLTSMPRSEWAPRVVYAVRHGDTLSAIAKRHGSSVDAIRAANSLSGSLIRPGQTLLVPRPGVDGPATAVIGRDAPGGVYVVRQADTLWDIARSFGVRVAQLCDHNGLAPNDPIHPGQRLAIPESS